jgi:ribosomal protein S18 acetylase RimI-like enzyme
VLREALKRLVPPGARELLRRAAKRAYSDVEGIVVEKDISASAAKDPTAPTFRGEIFEVTADSGREPYLSGLRPESEGLTRAKAERYFRSGFRGVAVRHEGEVVGAVWSVTRDESRLRSVHKDLRRLRVGISDGEAYMFDMYIEPEHRGLALSTALFRAGFRLLHARGISKVKGYYAVDNLPALWMHRVIGYEEVARVRVTQVLGLTCRYTYTAQNEPSPAKAASRP